MIEITYWALFAVFALGFICGGLWAYNLTKRKAILSTEIRLLEAEIKKHKKKLLEKLAEEQNGILQRKNARS